MASKSDYFENIVLNLAFNDPAFTEALMYMALCTVVPTDAST